MLPASPGTKTEPHQCSIILNTVSDAPKGNQRAAPFSLCYGLRHKQTSTHMDPLTISWSQTAALTSACVPAIQSATTHDSGLEPKLSRDRG